MYKEFWNGKWPGPDAIPPDPFTEEKPKSGGTKIWMFCYNIPLMGVNYVNLNVYDAQWWT